MLQRQEKNKNKIKKLQRKLGLKSLKSHCFNLI